MHIPAGRNFKNVFGRGLFAALSIARVFGAEDPAPAPLASIRIDKKPSAEYGNVVVTIKDKEKDKVRRVEANVYQVWPLDGGRHALLIRRRLQKGKPDFVLQYVDGETRKRRDLGTVPFTTARLAELRDSEGGAAYLLDGEAAGRPHLVVADIDAVHGRLEARLIKTAGQQVTYEAASQPVTVSLDQLLARRMTAIYVLPAETAGARYVQFLRDSNAIVERPNGVVDKGHWHTDGRTMHVDTGSGSALHLPQSALVASTGIPAGVRLGLRLEQALASNKLKTGDPIKAVLISPASIDGQIYMPQGTSFLGTAVDVHGVGWGVKHETAAMTLEFNQAKLPDGETVNLHSRLLQIENAQEKTNDFGKVQGIRSTGTLGYSAESKIASITTADPVGYIFSNAAATAALGFAEPEILYPAGTEALIEITAPVVRSKTYPRTIPLVASSPAQEQSVIDFIHGLTFRTMTASSKKPSDVTNLMFIGPADGLKRAFHAAGWLPTDELNANSTFSTVKTLAGNQNYRQAPMSMLLLDERPPILTLSKTTNTFASRHHLRVFDPHTKFEGTAVYTASSTQDIGIGFSRAHKTFIHVIDQYIDNERTKVVNDLSFTGCVEAAQLVPRSWVPLDAYNSTGDRLRTDGGIAVLRISECQNPRATPIINAVPPNRFERITRDTVLTIRNDFYRGNLVYQGVSGAMQLRQYMAHRNDLRQDPGAWRKSDLSGTQFKGIAVEASARQPSARAMPEDDDAPPPTDPEARSHRWDPPRYEIAVQGGYLRYPSLRSEVLGVLLTPEPGHENLPFGLSFLGDGVDGGWTVGLSVTLNTWRWVSNEFAYHYQRGKYEYDSLTLSEDPSDGLTSDVSGLATRQFSYNVLVHARRPESRWRPYVAAGPVFQLIALTDNVLKRPGGPYRLGLQNIGIFQSAFDFGRTPPLEGGGIFQFGLQYGGGIKFRVHPRLLIRADFRETWTPQPEFLRDSYTTEYFDTENYKVEFYRSPPDSKFRQQRITLGFAFTF